MKTTWTWEEKWAKEEGYIHREVDPLIQTLKTDPSPDKRKEAAWLLGHVRTFRSIIPLIEALQDDSLLVQKEAAKALNNIADYEKIADKEKLLALFQALQNENASVRTEAVSTLNQMAVQFATQYLRSTYNYYRRIGVQELLSMGKEAKVALPELVKALEDDDFFVKQGAIEALSQIGDSKADALQAEEVNVQRAKTKPEAGNNEEKYKYKERRNEVESQHKGLLS